MTLELLPLQIGVPGGMELAVILLIAVLLFGANKIPKLARSTGQAMGEFQRGRTEIEKELEDMKDTASLDEIPDIESGQTSSSEPSSGDESTDESK